MYENMYIRKRLDVHTFTIKIVGMYSKNGILQNALTLNKIELRM